MTPPAISASSRRLRRRHSLPAWPEGRAPSGFSINKEVSMTQIGNPKPVIDKVEIEQDISWLGARLREPSTYAGLGILLAALHLANAGDWVSAITAIGTGIGGIIAIVLPEAKRPRGNGGGAAGRALMLLALCAAAAAFVGAAPATAATKPPVHRPAASASARPSVTQAQQNPLIVVRQFTIADLQAALADAQAQTPPDIVAVNCYTALIPFVQSQTQNPLPAGAGVFQALQKARDAKAYLANIQSPTGPLASLNIACAPLVLDVQNTLVTLGVSVGVIANPVGAAAAVSGLPAAVAAFLGLHPL
jgi:hypothetical protein